MISQKNKVFDLIGQCILTGNFEYHSSSYYSAQIYYTHYSRQVNTSISGAFVFEITSGVAFV